MRRDDVRFTIAVDRSRDDDGDINLDDHTDLAACLLGPDTGLGTGCQCFDFDGDGDNDLLDFAAFQRNFSP